MDRLPLSRSGSRVGLYVLTLRGDRISALTRFESSFGVSAVPKEVATS
ncbi:hypothetical protein [Paractinoplanes durhamensis]|uniref:Uncharacterized protein n=1 Tax=Paractinoplanes durhamensis TaxID=113563 RepID=A0ABQ3Z4I4_9ACTN|nr:hypothetical protein [Actinoplanes durhamensis]GIE04717.1 hypothetical protein Adu01nite_60670 [Actinoplanes durhamensis]